MDISEILLGMLLENTYLILALGVFLGSLGVPVPSTLLVIASGAFAAQGFTNIGLVIFITAFSSSLADSIGFTLGRKLIKLHDSLPKFLVTLLDRGKSSFSSCSGRMIFLSRFLFTTIGSPVNILSGLYSCGFKRFIPYVVFGELIWALEMSLVGYWFGGNIELIFDFIGNLSYISLVALALYVVWKKIK